ncbi:MAG: class I SAM-dependent methyltransferase [Actinomycetota bacterium]|nr:class I SAM-dependent methyltransferase [Actinomycetota bacterium]
MTPRCPASPSGVDGITRSIRLFRAFRLEQSQPERFYRALADDSIAHLARRVDLSGARVLDVGGGPGWFADAFARAGAACVVVEPDRSELPEGGWREEVHGVLADGAALPFPDGAFDLSFSSNVLEHVARPWALADELVRTARRGGLVFVAFTNWLSPWGGHETSPWHLLGGERAARRYYRRHDAPPKNRYLTSLFPVHVGAAMRWARAHPRADLVDARPRYLPAWCAWLVAVPGLREVATWNLALVLRRR